MSTPESDPDLKKLVALTRSFDRAAAAKLPRGKLPVRVAEGGQWLYREAPIAREGLVQLLADALVCIDGRYFLHTWEQLLAIQVDDTPFTIIDYEREQEGQAFVLVSDRGHRVALDERTTLQLVSLPDGSQMTPCVDVGEGLMARLSRSTFYRLTELAHEGRHEGRPALLLDSGASSQLLGYLE